MARTVVQEALDRARKSIYLNNRFVSFLTLLVLPLILGLWVEKADPKVVGTIPFWTVITGIFLVQAFVFLKLDQKASEDTPHLVFEHAELSFENERLVQYASELSNSLENTVLAQILGRAWSAKQAHLSIFFKQDAPKIEDAIGSIIDPLISQAGKIFAWAYDDLWTVAVYRWSEADLRLDPVWWKRAAEHPSTGNPRSWRDGEGHCGTAFMSQETLFTDDLTDQSAFNRVRPTPGNVREYDREVYRSFATVPLTVTDSGGDVRLGVVTLTSNVVGRFGETNVGVAEHLGDVLAHVLYLNLLAQQTRSA